MWRHASIDTSRAPVFKWTGAPLVTSAEPPFGKALKIYRADRGAEQRTNLPEGRSIKVFYFEWDSIEAGPLIAISAHEAEVCNVAAGFKVLEAEEPRPVISAGGEALEFRYTKLEQADGQFVYVYKMPWVQGIGAWNVDSAHDRFLRLRRSFIRHRGAARVLQAGIFGAASEQEAWALFEREVLARLTWVRN